MMNTDLTASSRALPFGAAPTKPLERLNSSSSSCSLGSVDSNDGDRQLPEDFRPHKFAVLCGLGKQFCRATGNRRLKVLCNLFIDKYAKATTRDEKSGIAAEIVSIVHESCGGRGGFVRDRDGRGWESSHKFARRRVTTALRDCRPDKYASSSSIRLAKKQSERLQAKWRKQAGEFFEGTKPKDWQTLSSHESDEEDVSSLQLIDGDEHSPLSGTSMI